jgi:hypothetical protein
MYEPHAYNDFNVHTVKINASRQISGGSLSVGLGVNVTLRALFFCLEPPALSLTT